MMWTEQLSKHLIQPVGEPTVTKRKRCRQSAVLYATLTGDCLKRNDSYQKGLCVMPEGEKFQAVKSKKDDAENPSWQRSLHSNRRRQNRSHGERRQLLRTKIEID